MGALKPAGTGRAEIKRMRVHPDCQRRGFGQAVLDRLQRRAAELGIRRLHLETTARQLAAQKLYLANGFVEAGRRQFAGFDVIRFEKRL